ncbi:hypothetical protein Tco_0514873 [Tanacetum coccineum]
MYLPARKKAFTKNGDVKVKKSLIGTKKYTTRNGDDSRKPRQGYLKFSTVFCKRITVREVDDKLVRRLRIQGKEFTKPKMVKQSYLEALSSKESVQWKKAINEEIVSLEKNQTCITSKKEGITKIVDEPSYVGALNDTSTQHKSNGFQLAGQEENLECILKEILYRLIQEPRQWYLKFDSFMQKDKNEEPCNNVHQVGDEREVEVMRSFNLPLSELITDDCVLPKREVMEFADDGVFGLDEEEELGRLVLLDHVNAAITKVTTVGLKPSGAVARFGGEQEQVPKSVDDEKQQVPAMMREGVVSGDGDWRKGERWRK